MQVSVRCIAATTSSESGRAGGGAGERKSEGEGWPLGVGVVSSESVEIVSNCEAVEPSEDIQRHAHRLVSAGFA